jgi:hypothetical protein
VRSRANGDKAVSIDFHLANFPTLNQNHEPANPYPDVNSGMDCVPTSIAAALTWFTGTPYYGDEIIDQVSIYGPTYQGGTAAVNFESYCAQRGVSLFPVDGSPAQLVAAIHSQLHQYRPVLVTVPGQWNNPATSGQNPGDVTHVMVVCGDGPGSIQVMNPWTGAFEEYSDSWFEVKLCYGQIWPMEATHMVPAGWNDDPTNEILTAPNGQQVRYGFRKKILSMPDFDPANVPFGPEYAQDNVDGKGPGSRQDFAQWSFGYTTANQHIFYCAVGTELQAANAQIAALKAGSPTPATDTKAAAAKAALQAWLAE